MKDEIKVRNIEQQALDDLKALASCRDDEEVWIDFGINEMAKVLLDYITNLQQENKILKEEYRQTKLLKERYQLEKEYYKSRNEKAIDKIQYIIDYGFDYDGFNNVKDLKNLIDMLVDYARQSKDLLQGSDKDEKEN